MFGNAAFYQDNMKVMKLASLGTIVKGVISEPTGITAHPAVLIYEPVRNYPPPNQHCLLVLCSFYLYGKP